MPTSIKDFRVLIADSDKHHRSIVRNLLHAIGIDLDGVRQCNDGEEAIELLAVQPFDLIITGWQMKPLDGIALLKSLRDPKITPAPGIPVIFCSASMDVALVDAAYAAGADGILVKPFAASTLESHILTIRDTPHPLVRTETYVGPNTGNYKTDKDDDDYWYVC